MLNPRSGADRALPLLPRLEQQLRTLVDSLDVTVTEAPDDAERAARLAGEEACDALFVAGGDGTLNLALRGVASVPGALARLAIGVIPFGTGNDFARALGLGDDPEQALDLIVSRQLIATDVGLLNGRPFVNTSAGGFVADVSRAVTEELKDATGKLAYLIGGARALLGTEPFSAELALDGAAGGNAWEGPLEIRMFAACNSRTIGGGYPIAPRARIDDGLLDVFVVRQMATLEFVRLLQRIAAGEHERDERLRHFRASSFRLTFDRPVRVNTDGELFEASACEYACLHQAARFFAGPPAARATSPGRP